MRSPHQSRWSCQWSLMTTLALIVAPTVAASSPDLDPQLGAALATLASSVDLRPRSLAETARTFELIGLPPPAQVSLLASLPLSTPRDAVYAGLALPPALGLALLRSGRSLDGGFAPMPLHLAATVDTAESLLALAKMDAPPELVEPAIFALLRRQLQDGGFAAAQLGSDLPTTALAVRALAGFPTTPPTEGAIIRAVTWLRGADLSPAPVLYLALRADALAAADRFTVESLVELRAAAGADGHYGDIVGTAAAARALFFASPDLELEGLRVDAVEVPAGTPLRLQVELRNAGLDEAGASVLELRDGSGRITVVDVPALSGQERHTIDLEVDTQTRMGGLSLTVVADATEAVAERDETNNRQSVRVRVRPPSPADLEIRPDGVATRPLHLPHDTAFELAMTVRNRGDVASEATVVRAYLGPPEQGAPLLTSGVLPALPPHAEVTVVGGAAGLAAGVYRLVVVVDPEHETADGFRGNERAVRSLRVLDDADLEIKGPLTVSPGRVVGVHTPIELSALVQNSGVGPSPATRMVVSEGGAGELSSIEVPPLAPGQTTIVTLGFTPDEPRALTLVAQVDVDDAVIERDEINNLGSVVVDVQQFELVSRNAAVSGDLEIGFRAQLDAQVASRSTLAMGLVEIEARVGGPNGRAIGASTCGPFLAAPYGGEVLRQCGLSIATDGLAAGAQSLFFCVDSLNRIGELDESNNCAAATATFVNHPDFSLSLTFEPPDPVPDQDVVVSYQIGAPADWQARFVAFRAREGDRPLVSLSLRPQTPGQFVWRTPHARGPVDFHASVDGGRLFRDPDRLNNEVSRRFVLGGPPRVLRVKATGLLGLGEAVSGRASALVATVDAPTSVRFGAVMIQATPEAPAIFDFLPPAAGRQNVTLSTAPGPDRVFEVEARSPGRRPTLVSAEAIPEGVSVSFALDPPALGYEVFRDGLPVGGFTRALVPSTDLPGLVIRVPIQNELILADFETVGAAEIVIPGTVVHWRLSALVDGERELVLEESTSALNGVARVHRTFAPIRTRRLYFEVVELSESVNAPDLTLFGPARQAILPVVDEAVGAEPSSYTVVAIEDGARGESSEPLLVDRPLEGPAVAFEPALGPFVFRVTPSPGRRVSGYLVEVDGEADIDVELTPRVVPLSWANVGPGVMPIPFVEALGTRAIFKRVGADFDGPRSVHRVELESVSPGWEVRGHQLRPFAPGLHRYVEGVRPARADDGAASGRLRVFGPPLIDPAGGLFTRAAASGAHAVAVFPIDHQGRRGLPTLLDVDTSGPRALTNVTAVAVVDRGLAKVQLSFSATDELMQVEIQRAGVVIATVAARPSTYLDIPPQGRNTYRLTGIDAAGNRAPWVEVTVESGLAIPSVGAPSVVVTGFQVTATWAAPPGIGRYSVYVDDLQVAMAQEPRSVIIVGRPGAHTLRVASLGGLGGGTVGPPGPTTPFFIADDGPPLAVDFLPEALFGYRREELDLGHAVSLAQDFARYELFLNDEFEPLVSELRADPAIRFTYRAGVSSYRMRLRVVDLSGQVSPFREFFHQTRPHPAPITVLSALAADGTYAISAEGPTFWGAFAYIDGSQRCEYRSSGYTTLAVSSGTLDGNHHLIGSENGPPWIPALDDERPTIELRALDVSRTLVDRIDLAFTSAETRAVDYQIEVKPFGLPSRVVLDVQGNEATRVVHDLPDTPRAGGTSITLTVTRTGGERLALGQFHPQRCEIPLARQKPSHGGPIQHTTRSFNPGGTPGPHSPLVVLDVPLVDLSIDRGAFRLSDDELFVGSVVFGVVPVHNRGTVDALGVVVRLSQGPNGCAAGTRPLSEVTVDVPAGDASPAILGFTVADESGSLCISVDPDRRIAEVNESNNTDERPVAPDLPYRTEVYSTRDLAIFPCAPETRWVVRSPSLARPATGTLLLGQLATITGLSGVATVSADRPVVIHSGELQDATSLILRGCDGEVRGRDFLSDMPSNGGRIDPLVQAAIPSLIAWAPGAATHLLVSEYAHVGAQGVYAPSGLELISDRLDADEIRGFHPHVRPDGAPVSTLRVEALDADLIGWVYDDLGFPFAGPDGKLTGQSLTGFVGRQSQKYGARIEEVVMLSYDDDNRIELTRLDTGAVVWRGLLSRNGLYSATFPHAPEWNFIPLRVTSTGRVAAINMSLMGDVAYGYAHAFYVPGASGRLIDREFLVPLTRNGRSEDFAAVFAFYDSTLVRVFSPDTDAELLRVTLQRGQVIDLLADATAQDDPARRRLVVESDRPVSIYTGVGGAGAEIAPVLFSPENRPDLRVTLVASDPARPLPGEVVRVTAALVNEGAARARSVRVLAYDGEPAEGRLLEEFIFPRVDAGPSLPITLELGVSEGQRMVVFVTDPDDLVLETREDNNLTRFTLENPPDLEPLAVLADATVGQPFELRLPIQNHGGQAVEVATVTVYVEDALLGATQVEVSGAGLTLAAMPWRPEQAGATTLRVEVETDAVEAREDNNVWVGVVDVRAPDVDLRAEVRLLGSGFGPCDEVVVEVALLPPLASPERVVVALEKDGEEVARGLTNGDGRTTLVWAGDKALGGHLLRVVLDPDDDVEESDELNNVSEVPVDIVAYALSLLVAAPLEPVVAGRQVSLTITPSEPLPGGTVLVASGLRSVVASLDGPSRLEGIAPAEAGEVTVVVKGVMGDEVIASGGGRYRVVPADVELTLVAHPRTALPQEPVTLSAWASAEGTLRVLVDGEPLGLFEIAEGGGTARAVTLGQALGPHVSQAIFSPAAGGPDVISSADFERSALLPGVSVTVALPEVRTRRGEPFTAQVTVSGPRPSAPVEFSRIAVAITDDALSVVLDEEVVVERRRLEDDALTIDVAFPGQRHPVGTYRLVARVEREGVARPLGVTLAILNLEQEPMSDLGPLPDLGPDADDDPQALVDATERADLTSPADGLDAQTPPDATAPEDGSSLPDEPTDRPTFDLDPPDALEVSSPTDLRIDRDRADARGAGDGMVYDGGGDFAEGTTDTGPVAGVSSPTSDCGCRAASGRHTGFLFGLLGLIRALRPHRRRAS